MVTRKARRSILMKCVGWGSQFSMNYLQTFKNLFLEIVYNSGIWRAWQSLKFSLSFIRLHCEPCWGLCICPSNNETPFQYQTPGYSCVIMVVGDMLWALRNTSTSMCPLFAVSLINHFDTSRSPVGGHIDISYVLFTLFGLRLYCAQISLLAWTYFFQNKVLKVWRSFIIICLCFWCVQYAYLYWKSKLPPNITFFCWSSGINSDTIAN